jgi:hypothetical protein
MSLFSRIIDWIGTTKTNYPGGGYAWVFIPSGKFHRVDGPARKFSNGTTAWYLYGKLHRVDGPAYEEPTGYKAWYINGELHRVDGPAIVWSYGKKEWYINDKLHRVDGPVYEEPTRYKAWYINGKLHRVDGPAIECRDGRKSWYINDEPTTQEYIFALCAVRKFRDRVRKFNSVLGFNLAHLLKLSRTKAVIEWYYSPENGGGKLAKKRIERMFPDRI